jgi:hypothetical protein
LNPSRSTNSTATLAHPGHPTRLEQIAHSLGQVGAVVEAGEWIAGGQKLELPVRLAHGPDVGKRDQHRAGFAVARLDDRHDIFSNPDDIAVGQLQTDRDAEQGFAGRQHSSGRAIGLGDDGTVLVIRTHHHRQNVVADQVGTRPQNALRARIAGQHHAVARLHDDAFVQMVHNQPVMLLAVREALRHGVLMDRETDAVADVVEHRRFFGARSARCAVIDRERAQHRAGIVFKWHRPARSQAERQREVPKIGPQRIGFDIFDSDHAPLVHRGAAGSDPWADRDAVDRGTEVRRQRWRAAHARAYAVRVEQQDRTGRTIAQQRFRAAAYFIEQFRQRGVAGNQPQHRTLRRQHPFGPVRPVAGALRRCSHRAI